MTKKLNVFIYVQERNGEISVKASSDEFFTTYCCSTSHIVSAPLTAIKIDAPDISSEEAQKVLSGSLLSSLIEEREKLVTETAQKLERIEQRIADMKCLDFKG